MFSRRWRRLDFAMIIFRSRLALNLAQVNQLCNRLAEKGLIRRDKGICPRDVHRKKKLINSVSIAPSLPTISSTGASVLGVLERGVNICDAWRHVDRFCKAVWPKYFKKDVPLRLADLISALRDEDKHIVPSHVAIMMHTIRVLRNEIVHEDGPYGIREQTIVSMAYAIVAEWAETNEGDFWRQASRSL